MTRQVALPTLLRTPVCGTNSSRPLFGFQLLFLSETSLPIPPSYSPSSRFSFYCGFVEIPPFAHPEVVMVLPRQSNSSCVGVLPIPRRRLITLPLKLALPDPKTPPITTFGPTPKNITASPHPSFLLNRIRLQPPTNCSTKMVNPPRQSQSCCGPKKSPSLSCFFPFSWLSPRRDSLYPPSFLGHAMLPLDSLELLFLARHALLVAGHNILG